METIKHTPTTWINEPNKDQFIHAGFQCAMVRSEYFGHWCGYVCLPESHPLYEIFGGFESINVHGGITFSGFGSGDWPIQGASKLWFLGFDCNHAGDLAPFTKYQHQDSVYRDYAYVKSEVESLARQLADIKFTSITLANNELEELKRKAELCDELVSALQILVDNGGIGSENMFENARAALFKAKGETA